MSQHGIFTIDEQLSRVLSEVLGSEAEGLPETLLRWEIPKDPSFGDLSCAIGFKMAGLRRMGPQAVAEELATRLFHSCQANSLGVWIEKVEAKAGFLNVFLSHPALCQLLREVLLRRHRYGLHRLRQAPSINIEFLSANPTGPLSVAHGRQAVAGDTLARLLRSQGFRVTTEYYLNDEGRQIELLGRSLRHRCLELAGKPEAFPDDGYHGSYLYDVASDFLRRYGDGYVTQPEARTLPTFMRFGMKTLLQGIREDLERFGLSFDRWSSQRWLRVQGRIEKALGLLKEQGVLYESEAAMWFASTRFGDDKDRVVRKSNGELTYLAPDIAYHQWKMQRGYARLINLWGPDHHGYIPRLKAAMTALGFSDRLTVRIVQLVTLTRHGTPVPMSKRQGEFVTFREVLDEVGTDATRFFFLMRTMESPLDFDLDLAKSQSQENPVYYVQYAHARLSSILAKCPALPPRPDLTLLQEPEERLLLRVLFQYPIVLRICARALEPHGITGYLRRLAESVHIFYTKHRVISEDQARSAARIALVKATRQVLANGLSLLGVNAPVKM